MFSTSYRSSSPATTDSGLLHSSGLAAAVTGPGGIRSFGAPARTPRAIASKIARYFASSYFDGSFPISTDETIGRAPDGPKARANASPYARGSRAGSVHRPGVRPSNMKHASTSNPALTHDP